MLLREVYIFERIETLFETDERSTHMKCIVMLRPTKDNIQLLCKELNRPHYRSYHLCKFDRRVICDLFSLKDIYNINECARLHL